LPVAQAPVRRCSTYANRLSPLALDRRGSRADTTQA
jgi:hypothetical protein